MDKMYYRGMYPIAMSWNLLKRMYVKLIVHLYFTLPFLRDKIFLLALHFN
jgi:hypothetical protein